jgi:hypothetical protein
MCVIVPIIFPCSSTNSNLKVSPIDRIIYYFAAFGQLLLFIGLHIWAVLFALFADVIQAQKDVLLLSKILRYQGLVLMLIYVWILAATGRFGEIKWWPSHDRLSCLVPPSIKNMTMTKCRWSLLFYQS